MPVEQPVVFNGVTFQVLSGNFWVKTKDQTNNN